MHIYQGFDYAFWSTDVESRYEFKRTRSWWKLKDEDSEDGEIIDFEPGDPDSGFANTLGKIVIRLENGVIVRASGIKHKYLDEIPWYAC